MHLAINYSPAAAKLVKGGKIDTDYFKTPDWDWLIDEAKSIRPVAVHFTLEAGNDSLGLVDWDRVRQLSQNTATPYINLHLDARQRDYPESLVDTTVTSEVKRIFDIILTDINTVVEQFGPERVIVENSPYRGISGNTMRMCVLPEMITQVVEETGCGLLLDIAHAIVTSKTLGMEVDEYISKLPVTRLKEMHFAGIHLDPISGMWDDHLSIQENDWYWLDWVIDRIHSGEWNHPWLLAFEYGGVGEPFAGRTDPEVIEKQVPELRQHLKSLLS